MNPVLATGFFSPEAMNSFAGVLTAASLIFGAYLTYKAKLRDKDHEESESQEERIDKLYKRIDNYIDLMQEIKKENYSQSLKVNLLTEQVEEMNDKIKALEKSLEKERAEKNEFKIKYERELAHKMRIMEENRNLKNDIVRLQKEYQMLRAQLGIPDSNKEEK